MCWELGSCWGSLSVAVVAMEDCQEGRDEEKLAEKINTAHGHSLVNRTVKKKLFN